MPISGLVVKLSPDAGAARLAIGAIGGRPQFTCDTLRGDHHLPVVLETADRAEDKAAWDWLHALPGVVHVDVVFIHFDDRDAPLPNPALFGATG